jgi:hypothetical protein
MENLRKKKETNTKHKITPANQVKQVENRISELEDKMEIKGKMAELLVKQLKTCKRNSLTPSKDQT